MDDSDSDNERHSSDKDQNRPVAVAKMRNFLLLSLSLTTFLAFAQGAHKQGLGDTLHGSDPETRRIVRNPDWVEVYQLDNSHIPASRVGKAVRLSRAQLAKLERAITAPRESAVDPKCTPSPGFEFAFHKGSKEATMDVCFQCNVVEYSSQQRPPNGGPGHMTPTFIRVNRSEASIAAVRKPMLKLVKSLFPKNQGVQSIQ